MFDTLVKKIFGSQSEREYKKSLPTVEMVNKLSDQMNNLSDNELQLKTNNFRQQLRHRVEKQSDRIKEIEIELTNDLEHEIRDQLNDELDDLERSCREHEVEFLNEIMPEAFAMVKEACRRLQGRQWDRAGETVSWEMIPYDVQIFGGLMLHNGKIAEMATGEGKTLVATMPLFLNAIPGRGTHLITHNEYLARRDGMWMGPLFNFLGLSVGIIQDIHQTGHDAFLLPRAEGSPTEFKWQTVGHKQAYEADIVYATCSQVGFDYLRDNMSVRTEDVMQRAFNYAIVDEADSILIDDARTPLILSGPVPDSTNQYSQMKPLVQKLIRAQTALANKVVSEAEKQARAEGEYEYELGIELLKATRGAPKNRRLMKVLQEEGVKKLINRVEADYMRDKNMSAIDEQLFFVVDERANTIDLTEKGRDLLSPDEQALFILPDISLEIDAIRKDENIDSENRQVKEEECHRTYAEKSEAVHNINQLMKAYTLFEKDVQYMVSDDGRVVIIDESTGRPQPGRRFSDGLHQALEAKEGVKLQHETQTIATITLQNLFRMYKKLSGMTGTAETEAGELWEIYKLDVTVIPTNRPIRRVDHEDLIYRTRKEKFQAIIDEVARLHEKKLPVLVGTASVEASELLSRMMTRRGIKHQLLNARYHEKEAQIVTDAGLSGAVTIATNMAGRGTDIKLAPDVIRIEREIIDSKKTLDDKLSSHKTLRQHLIEEPSGLQVIGTERHEARRIDRQLRGRSGRQGDPGSSRFFLSLEDDLMRLFGSDRIASVMDRLGAEEGEVIEHSMVTKSIERAQKKVEARNFEVRKHVLDYDDVMNQQRQVIYNRRRDILERESAHELLQEMISEWIDNLIHDHAGAEKHPEEWDWEAMEIDFGSTFYTGFNLTSKERGEISNEQLRESLVNTAEAAYQRRLNVVGIDTFREIEKAISLHTIDLCWQEHLQEIDELKDGIGFVGVGGKNPLIEYKKGAFSIFEDLIDRINHDTLKNLFQLRIDTDTSQFGQPSTPHNYREEHRDSTNMAFRSMDTVVASPGNSTQGGLPLSKSNRDPEQLTASGPGNSGEKQHKQPIRVDPKVGRNETCPCGSGKKFKRCCGINS